MIADLQQLQDHSERAAIVVDDVYKTYRQGAVSTPVLTGVGFEVAQGQCVFLAGPSGSGKTTLLSILGCILTPDSGRVRILGQEIGRLSAAGRVALRRDGIGFVFQRFHLIRGLTALDNVCVPLTLRAVPPRRARKRAIAALEAVGLADKLTSHPRNLSAGQCQRVAMARALAGDPEVILADEPTAALDGANGQGVMRMLRRLTVDQGKTVVVVTHDQRIFEYADRLLCLENGRITETRELACSTSV